MSCCSNTAKHCIAIFLSLLLTTKQVSGQKNGDTLFIYFPTDISTLSTESKQYLDSLRYFEAIDPGMDAMIIGYADYVGTDDYNAQLSKRRALEVKKYLMSLGFKEEYITYCIGKGEISRPEMKDNRGMEPDRRVDIVMLRKKRAPKIVVAEKKKTILPVNKPTAAAPAIKTPDRKSPPPMPRNVQRVSEVYATMDSIDRLQVNQAFVLKNVYFPPNSHFVTKDSRPELERLAETLKKNPDVMIMIEGHICCVTHYPDAYDEDSNDFFLSMNRARYIYDYLILKGIEPDRLQYRGFGRSRPVVFLELSEEDSQKNRRVEIRIISRG